MYSGARPASQKGKPHLNTAVISNTHYACERGGCKYAVACQLHSEAIDLQHKAETAVKGSRMGFALWCDQHNGSFGPKEGHATMSRTIYIDGKEEVEERIVCSKCLSKLSEATATPDVPAIDS